MTRCRSSCAHSRGAIAFAVALLSACGSSDGPQPGPVPTPTPPAATYLITTSSSPSGAGTTSGGGYVNSGSSVTINASPNSGYAFTNWSESGSSMSTSASYTFTANANRSLVANFAASANVLLSEDFSGGTINTSRWFVLESGKNSMSVDAAFGSPAPSLKFVWPNNVQGQQGLQATQTFDVLPNGITFSFDRSDPSATNGQATAQPNWQLALTKAGGGGTVLITGNAPGRMQIGCFLGGSVYPLMYTDGTMHHYTVNISPAGEITWTRDGSVLINGSVSSGCRDSGNVGVYTFSFYASAMASSSITYAAYIDNIKVTRP